MRLRIYIIMATFGALAACGQVCAQEHRMPFITAPLVSVSPTVDGKINQSEWAGACGVSGLLKYGTDRFSGEKTEFWVCRDASSIYLAWRRYQTRIPKADISVRDGGLWSDDSVELFFQPRQGTGLCYQFIGNAAGVFLDGRSIDPKWDGQWTYATSVTTAYWEAELQIPWTTLSTETLDDGNVIGLSFCTDIQSLPPQSETWAALGNASFHETTRYGSLIARGAVPTVFLQLPADIKSSKVGAVVDMANPTASKRVIRVVTDVQRGGKPLEQVSNDYDLAPGATRNLNELKAREPGDYDISIRVSDVTNGGDVPLAGRVMTISLTQPPLVKLDPAGKWVEVVVDTQGMSKLEEARLYVVLASADRDIAGQLVSLNSGTKNVKARLNLTRVKPGTYTLTAFIAAGTQRLMEYKQAVEKK